jgi:hypothetical protein
MEMSGHFTTRSFYLIESGEDNFWIRDWVGLRPSLDKHLLLPSGVEKWLQRRPVSLLYWLSYLGHIKTKQNVYYNKTGNVCINVTVKRVRVTIFAVEKQ